MRNTLIQPPVRERGWIVEVLRPRRREGYIELPACWERLPRRFATKRYAMHVVRREIRSATALAARLYWGGSLHAHWQRDPKTGREAKRDIVELT